MKQFYLLLFLLLMPNRLNPMQSCKEHSNRSIFIFPPGRSQEEIEAVYALILLELDQRTPNKKRNKVVTLRDPHKNKLTFTPFCAQQQQQTD